MWRVTFSIFIATLFFIKKTVSVILLVKSFSVFVVTFSQIEKAINLTPEIPMPVKITQNQSIVSYLIKEKLNRLFFIAVIFRNIKFG